MKSLGTFAAVCFATLLCLGSLSGCTSEGSSPAPTLTLLPDTPEEPTPLPPPPSDTGGTPEAVLTKQVMEEIESIQEDAKAEPALALTAEDIELLNEESLLETPAQLNGWVR